jgi:hypothetical protein
MNAEDIENSSEGGMYYNGKYTKIKIKVLEVKKLG